MDKEITLSPSDEVVAYQQFETDDQGRTMTTGPVKIRGKIDLKKGYKYRLRMDDGSFMVFEPDADGRDVPGKCWKE